MPDAEVTTPDGASTPDPFLDHLNRSPLAPETLLPGDIHEDDDDALLTKVLGESRFPAGARVGDGTPGPGRRRLDIDERVVRAMAMVGGTIEEIAAFCACSPDHILRRFSAVIKAARSTRKLKLRQAQMQAALAGNVTMQIWLGKQELGQFDESKMRVGDLARFTDEELQQLAQGKIPGQLGRGSNDVDKDEK